ncbi:MAG: FHA domain-containing protein [Planctomycetia bacterium]
MGIVSFHVIDGVDKGRSFLQLKTPVTIGREEGNTVRLNDDRVSRFHAKIQEDQAQIVLTDLDSTNGTSVNGETVQLRLLRAGDRVSLGRSTLLFGTLEEIAAQLRQKSGGGMILQGARSQKATSDSEKTLGSVDDLGDGEGEPQPILDDLTDLQPADVFARVPPPLPTRLSPAQAAQLSEVIDFLHRAVADAIEPVSIPTTAKEARLPIDNWQRVQLVMTFLAQYARQVSEPSL